MMSWSNLKDEFVRTFFEEIKNDEASKLTNYSDSDKSKVN